MTVFLPKCPRCGEPTVFHSLTYQDNEGTGYEVKCNKCLMSIMVEDKNEGMKNFKVTIY